MLVYWLDIVGTAVFAISGVLLAGKLRMDPFGVLVLGVVTAVGGGTIRDMALDHGPVFWVKDPTDLVVAMVTSMLTIVLVRQPRRLPKWMLPVLDAVGLAVFVGIGVNKAFNAEAGPLIAVCMGVITGVGGGIIRDVLVNGTADQILQAHRINHQANALFFDGHIAFVHLIIKGETILEAAATATGDIHA